MGDNVVVSNMELERLLSMKGGKGEGSYANNSQAQVPSPSLFLFPLTNKMKLKPLNLRKEISFTYLESKILIFKYIYMKYIMS